ncbi:MAG: restriction endonuclease subunit S [Armatimonadetes bacterium]|nr:restriction endonuclease subunit S [Armatimonadota bacterium]
MALSGHGSADQVTSIKSRFRKGDILFGKLRPYFRKVVIAPFDGVCSTDIWVVRPRQGIDQRYLFYWMASYEFIEESTRASEGTRMPRAQWEFISRIEKRVPAMKEQQAIACILGAMDDKIELNRRMNETLESMAKALFKSWFVDFHPVRAKAAGQKPVGLAPHIADLFPDAFEESELGEIPKGWKICQLPEAVDINPPRLLSRGALAPYLDMAGMPTQGPSPESWMMREVGSGMKFINGDTLVARITPCLENGKTAYVDFLADGEVGWGSTEYIVIRPKGKIPPVFAYLLARTDEFRTFAIQQMTGSSGRQRVPATALEKYRITIPSMDSPLFKHFGDLVSPMFDQMNAAVRQSRTLAALRDTLLPKLIFGELRVPDGERTVRRCI